MEAGDAIAGVRDLLACIGKPEDEVREIVRVICDWGTEAPLESMARLGLGPGETGFPPDQMGRALRNTFAVALLIEVRILDCALGCLHADFFRGDSLLTPGL
jgi:hypothetical protein